MRSLMHRLAVISVFMGISSIPVLSDAALARVGSPAVSFTATGPAGLSIVGKTSDLEVFQAGPNLMVRVKLADLDTGIGLRNKHMKEKYLQVQQYPNADLMVPRAALKLPERGGEGGGDAVGTVMLHGASKPVSFTYRAKHEGDRYHVTGTLHLNMKEFNIDVPSYLGVTVKPEVDVAVAFDATE